MTIHPVQAWSHAGLLWDVLRNTRADVAAVNFPFPSPYQQEGQDLVSTICEQLDQHMIPRLSERAAPAVAVVAGSTGSGKSTLVNALVGAESTQTGVLRPTTMRPHVFHHPGDVELLTTVVQDAEIGESDQVPRGLVIVDSPDVDSLVGANRDTARALLDAADLWIFVTTAARYGDAVPWELLRSGAERGAAIAVVLNRVTADVAAHVRRDLVERLRRDGLENLPLFVIPEVEGSAEQLPRDVAQGLGRWLDSVGESHAHELVERTMEGSVQTLKEWLERLAMLMDDQAASIKRVRADVRRAAARTAQDAGEFWFREIAEGAIATRWTQAVKEGAPFHKVRVSAWTKRRGAREERDSILEDIRADLQEAVEASLTYAAGHASESMADVLGEDSGDAGEWLLSLRDADEAREARSRHARDAAMSWNAQIRHIATTLPSADAAISLVGEEGLTTIFASAVVGVPPARQVLALLVGSGLQPQFDDARDRLASARSYCINKEALDAIAPSEDMGLLPDASSVIRLRRAEIRSLT